MRSTLVLRGEEKTLSGKPEGGRRPCYRSDRKVSVSALSTISSRGPRGGLKPFTVGKNRSFDLFRDVSAVVGAFEVSCLLRVCEEAHLDQHGRHGGSVHDEEGRLLDGGKLSRWCWIHVFAEDFRQNEARAKTAASPQVFDNNLGILARFVRWITATNEYLDASGFVVRRGVCVKAHEEIGADGCCSIQSLLKSESDVLFASHGHSQTLLVTKTLSEVSGDIERDFGLEESSSSGAGIGPAVSRVNDNVKGSGGIDGAKTKQTESGKGGSKIHFSLVCV